MIDDDSVNTTMYRFVWEGGEGGVRYVRNQLPVTQCDDGRAVIAQPQSITQ